MGHINPKSFDILQNAGGTGVKFDDSVSPCDTCEFGKSKQAVHPQKAIHDVNTSL